MLTIHASSTNGDITKIEEISGLNSNEDGTYTISQNGTYNFVVTDVTGQTKTKKITISNIDKIEPKSFTPIILNIGARRVKVEAKTEDSDSTLENAKSGIEKYEYYINNMKQDETTESIFEITNLNKSTTYSIYVIAYDQAGNTKKSETVTVTTTSGEYATLTPNGMQKVEDLAADALQTTVYDNDFKTYQAIGYYDESTPQTYWFKIDKSCWGKYITVFGRLNSTYDYGYASMAFYNEYNKNQILAGTLLSLSGSEDSLKLCCRSVLIPEGSNWAWFNVGTTSGLKMDVYEVWCSEENLTNQTFEQ